MAGAPPVSEKHAAEMARGLALFKSDVRAVLKQTEGRVLSSWTGKIRLNHRNV